MMTQTERSLSDMTKLLRQEVDLMEKKNKLLKEQNEILRELIKKQEGCYYYSVTKSTMAEEEDDDEFNHDICYTCGYNRSDNDPIEDQMNCVKYCMHCKDGNMWIPKEDENGGE